MLKKITPYTAMLKTRISAAIVAFALSGSTAPYAEPITEQSKPQTETLTVQSAADKAAHRAPAAVFEFRQSEQAAAAEADAAVLAAILAAAGRSPRPSGGVR